MKTSLALILFGIDDWEKWRSRLEQPALDDTAMEIVRRTTRFLRCYDSLGRCGEGEFALVLPGCNSFNAVYLAERLRMVVFGSPFVVGGAEIRFAACFGVSGSGGRSPLVVLRNGEQALNVARSKGAGSIERCAYDAEPDPATFLMPVIEDGALHW
jgi:GGDEF domain-containing protein